VVAAPTLLPTITIEELPARQFPDPTDPLLDSADGAFDHIVDRLLHGELGQVANPVDTGPAPDRPNDELLDEADASFDRILRDLDP